MPRTVLGASTTAAGRRVGLVLSGRRRNLWDDRPQLIDVDRDYKTTRVVRQVVVAVVETELQRGGGRRGELGLASTLYHLRSDAEYDGVLPEVGKGKAGGGGGA